MKGLREFNGEPPAASGYVSHGEVRYKGRAPNLRGAARPMDSCAGVAPSFLRAGVSSNQISPLLLPARFWSPKISRGASPRRFSRPDLAGEQARAIFLDPDFEDLAPRVLPSCEILWSLLPARNLSKKLLSRLLAPGGHAKIAFRAGARCGTCPPWLGFPLRKTRPSPSAPGWTRRFLWRGRRRTRSATPKLPQSPRTRGSIGALAASRAPSTGARRSMSRCPPLSLPTAASLLRNLPGPN